MKNIILLFLMLLAKQVFAQVLVPYRIGKKFGLSDEKGKITVAPAYDDIEYLQGNYFQYTNLDAGARARQTGAPSARRVDSFGLFYKNNLIIKDQPYKHFLIYDHCIVGSRNAYHPEDCMLFNLKGKPVLHQPVRGLGVNERRDFGDLVGLSEKFTLLMILERDESRVRRYTLAAYSNKKQQITDWFLKKVTDLKVKEDRGSGPGMLFTYYDENGFQEKFFRFRNERFELVSEIPSVYKEKEKISAVGDKGSDMQVEDINETRLEAPSIVESNAKDNANRYTYYHITRDSLFYSDGQDNTFVALPSNVSPVFLYKTNRLQSTPLIYKKEQKFGLIINGVLNNTLYDSLLYFGEHFIAGIKTNNVFRFGIINKQGGVAVPVIYDSIQGKMKVIDVEDSGSGPGKRKQYLAIKNKKDDGMETYMGKYVKQAANEIVVYKNGKPGLINNKNEVIIPFDYDLIAKIGMQYYNRPHSDFILLQKNGLYGATTLEYDRAAFRYSLSHTINPVAKYIPCFYLNDYYNIKGLRLYGLYNDAFEFMGYMNEKGFGYYGE